MKNKTLAMLAALVLLFSGFTGGYFYGRNTRVTGIQTTKTVYETVPPETVVVLREVLVTLPPEKTSPPPETTAPTVSDPFAEYYALLEYTWPDTNWLHNAMGCIFESPAEIDLEYLFYAGFRLGSWDLLSPESEAQLIEQGFWREMDIQPMPVEQLEQVLQDNFGISLSDCTIPEGWAYVEQEDFYCSNHNDAFGVLNAFTVTWVDEYAGGRIDVFYSVDGSYYNTATGEWLDNPDMVLALRQQPDGSFLILANIEAPNK